MTQETQSLCGRIEDVRIYDRVLTAAEIKALALRRASEAKNPTFDLTTVKGVMDASCDHMAKMTFALGNEALGRVWMSEAFRAAMDRVDQQALRHDVQATKTACRALWVVVKDILNEMA